MSIQSAHDAETSPQWHASKFCNNGSCVEVARLPGNRVGVRDNKNPNSAILAYSSAEWADFIEDIKRIE